MVDLSSFSSFWLPPLIGAWVIAFALIWRRVTAATLRRELAWTTAHDRLTRLPLADQVMLKIEAGLRQDEPLALIVVDIDRFKTISDSLGHEVSEQLLRAVARRLSAILGPEHVLGRRGGDEFLVLTGVPCTAERATRVAERVHAAFFRAFEVDGRELRVTATLGISTSGPDAPDAQALVENADAALRAAKRAGRNRLQFYIPGMNAVARQRLETEKGLRRALANGELVLHYQPKVDLKTGVVSSVEALARWRDPTRGLLEPDLFIPVAEETGLIGAIGEWALRTACLQAVQWQREGLPPTRVAINLAPSQFQQTDLLDVIQQVFAETGLSPRYLELELTEATLQQHPEETSRVLNVLARRGVHVSIDNYGTGFSSLARLRPLPLKALKIDRSFVRRMTEDPQAESLVRTIIGMAHNLQLDAVAEGVETTAQLDALRALGCDHYQGFLFSPAVEALRIPELLAPPAPAWRASERSPKKVTEVRS